MKKLILRNLFLVLIALPLSLNSCTIWGTKKWQNLEDKKFYLTRYTYVIPGYDSRRGLRFMKQFPLQEALALVEKDLGITIDTTEWDEFGNQKDADLDLQTFGVIKEKYFIWKSKKKHDQKVEMKYVVDFPSEFEENIEAKREYSLVVKTGRFVRAVYEDYVESKKDVIKNLAEKTGK